MSFCGMRGTSNKKHDKTEAEARTAGPHQPKLRFAPFENELKRSGSTLKGTRGQKVATSEEATNRLKKKRMKRVSEEFRRTSDEWHMQGRSVAELAKPLQVLFFCIR